MGSITITIVGIVIVFLALVILAFLIGLFSKILNFFKRSPARESDSVHETVQTGTGNESGNVTSIINLDNNPVSDEEIIAVLAAAISAYVSSGRSNTSNLYVRSFRRVSGQTPVWKVASDIKQIQSSVY